MTRKSLKRNFPEDDSEASQPSIKLKKTEESSVDGSTSESDRRKRQAEDCTSPSKKAKTDSTLNASGKKKHGRKRMKSLLHSIARQMEFYFSDSNLLKDRFLKNLIDQTEDGYVDLTIFGKFNKLQSLSKDGVSQAVLVKALKTSNLLEVNKEETKVRRVTPIPEITQEEIDSRTVYVEHLPLHATHAWISSIFSRCGQVVYVSLPVYKTSQQIKRFAFVEFDTSEAANRACQLLNNPPPSKVQEKPGLFPKTNKTISRLHKVVDPAIIKDESSNTQAEENSSDRLNEIKTKETDSLDKQKEEKVLGQLKVENLSGKPEPREQSVESGAAQPTQKKKKNSKRKLCSDDGTIKKDHSERKKKKMSIESTDNSSTKCERTDEGSIQGEDKNQQTDGPGNNPQDGVCKGSKQKDTKSAPGEERLKKKKKKRKAEKEEAKKVEVPQEPASHTPGEKLSRKARKLLRQADIRRKKMAAESEVKNPAPETQEEDKSQVNSTSAAEPESEKITSILKLKKGQEKKKVDFDLVPRTTEFLQGREMRKRKKPKKDELHLRVIAKKEWLSLKAEYIAQQKTHVAALKESLRELKQQENTDKPTGNGHVDLQDVFGTKRMKASHEVKMAHVEALKFTPNVIVQWKCSHEVHRDKIKTMFKEMSGDQIAYIDAKEEAKTGYIRFKDADSAEQFAQMSRNSTYFMARVLPMEQQEAYWVKANEDRMKKLSGKKKEKGSEKISRKVFERNRATFHEKPTRIVFSDEPVESKE